MMGFAKLFHFIFMQHQRLTIFQGLYLKMGWRLIDKTVHDRDKHILLKKPHDKFPVIDVRANFNHALFDKKDLLTDLPFSDQKIPFLKIPFAKMSE